MDEIRCQMCGKPNPADEEVCRYCQARLKPLRAAPPPEESAAPKGRQLPQTEELNWLRSLASLGEEKPSADKSTDESVEPDWLASLQEEGELPAEEESAGETALPDWLQAMESSSEGEQAPQEEAPEPDWLASLQEEGELPAEEESAGEAALPDWLQAMESTSEGEQAPQEEAPEPDWLASLQEEGELPAEEESAGEAALPDRLQAMESTSEGEQAPQEEGELPEEASRAETEIPDWLSEIEIPAGPEETEALPGEGETGAAEEAIPDWLQEIASAEAGPSEPSEALEAEGISEEQDALLGRDTEVPDWLADIAPAAGESQAFTLEPIEGLEEVLSGEEVGDLSLEELPDWLGEEGLAEVPVPADTGEEEAEIAPAELPSWLQAMRPVEAVVEETVTEEAEGETVEYGPLAGLSGVLPAGMERMAIVKPPPYSTKLEVGQRQQQRLAQLQNLLTTEDNPTSLPSPGVLPAQRVFRWLVSLVLLLAILVPAFSGSQATPLPSTIPPETLAVSQTVRELPKQAPVLVAFDYQPAFAGEVEAAAQPVLADLMSHQARLTLLSTLPTGQTQAERLLHTGLQDYHYTAPAQYLNLGYLPGGPVGLRQFAHFPALSRPFTVDNQPAWGQANALDGVQRLSDFALVLVITDDPDVARGWIEQVGPALENTPLLMVISAQAEPLVRPYFETTPPQVRGLVTGLAGGAAYASLSGQAGLPRLYWDSLAIGALVAELLFFFGGLFYLGLGIWHRRKGTTAHGVE